jgi:hypothetical protein
MPLGDGGDELSEGGGGLGDDGGGEGDGGGGLAFIPRTFVYSP